MEFDIVRARAEAVQERASRMPRVAVTTATLALLGVFFAYFALVRPSPIFPAGHVLEIPEDAHVGEMAVLLKEAGVIRSTFVFRAYARLTLQDRKLASGLYIFERPLGTAALVRRLAESEHGIAARHVTLTEGMTVDDMARALKAELPDFDTAHFLLIASTSEGYLFPDTYYVMPNTTPEEVYERLRTRFNEQVEPLAPEIEASGRTLSDIVIMASLLEREAKTEEDMRIVAGILWKRLDTGMLLQVDAPFGYIHGENGYTPTQTDLDSSSRYNTYKRQGLTPTPIANPGLVAIRAALHPIQSDYFYYLTGRDGLMHYARNFEEHKQNRARYLD